MTDAQQALFDRLAARVAARTGLDLDAARDAVDDALVHRGEHLAVVRVEVTAMIDEIRAPVADAYQAMGRPLHRAVDAAAESPGEQGRNAEKAEHDRSDEYAANGGEPLESGTREGVQERDRGLRMAAHHPDLAELDRMLNALYERPDRGSGG